MRKQETYEKSVMWEKRRFYELLDKHIALFSNLGKIVDDVISAGLLITSALGKRNKVLICGNGGSAADAQHFAAELIGRFEKERSPFPAIALTTDTSILTALSNDYGYNEVFSRQVEGLGELGDVFVAVSTSGNSKNLIAAAESAQKLGIKSIGLLGRDGGELAPKVDIAVIIPHTVTARIQEAHVFIIHFWAACVERALFE